MKSLKTIHYIRITTLVIIAGTIISCTESSKQQLPTNQEHIHLSNLTFQSVMADTSKQEKVVKSEEEWKEILTSSQYRILRKGGTEMPYINEYNSVYEDGVYVCAACGNPLFDSETKYKSGSGWPSYWKPISSEAVGEREDNSLMMTRTEIICNRCESHLGHVFDDGPEPTGLRYCMNSAAMKLVKKDK